MGLHLGIFTFLLKCFQERGNIIAEYLVYGNVATAMSSIVQEGSEALIVIQMKNSKALIEEGVELKRWTRWTIRFYVI